ncbi:EamA family transporter RarD [Porticoccus sp. W117]|uniref:EamA family transporter RarD n=1 Tax=Porticoccus sp. W117 TaxID=3054777 RepID=UPI002594108A|nr:EamA family transporter RarD [Porticoccus sp. W117]MDM3870388.1 EamA family transporter RarD [Porticoccus sp. W117]
MNTQKNSRTRIGLYNALGAFAMWGLVPIYFKSLAQVGALEILAHRVLWSLLFLLVVMWLTARWQSFLAILRNRRLMGWLLCSSLTIAINWLVFIWAVAEGRILETSLGYFITPLMNVFLGVLFLGERLRPAQWAAVALAAIGVAWQIGQVGYLPWVALVLSVSFGLYGLLRKKVSVDATLGLGVEVLVLLPLAAGYLLGLAASGEMAFVAQGSTITGLLLAAGLITSLPLLCYAAAANRLNLSVVGVVQYLTPSITFFLAVFFYKEAFDSNSLITFAFIWLALAVFTVDGLRR